MGYAASGQLTSDQKNGTTYVNVYDDAGRMVEARNGTTPFATYAYDAFEQRVSKTTTAAAPGGASNVHFIHDLFGARNEREGKPSRRSADQGAVW